MQSILELLLRQLPANAVGRGVHPPKPMMYTAFSPISTTFINSHIFVKFTFFLIYVFASLIWPWCTYASCFTRTGRPWR